MSVQAATYYEILGVGRRARPDSLRLAYRRLAQRFHPDKMPGNADAERVMAAVNEAYSVLSDPQQRARYDAWIEQSHVSRRLAHESFLARLEDPGAAWPWYLLFATMTFCAAAIGVTVYKTHVPGASSPAPVVQPALKVVRK